MIFVSKYFEQTAKFSELALFFALNPVTRSGKFKASLHAVPFCMFPANSSLTYHQNGTWAPHDIIYLIFKIYLVKRVSEFLSLAGDDEYR